MTPARGHALALTIGLGFTAQKLWIAYCTRESLIPESPLTDSEFYTVSLVDSLTALWVGALMSFRCVLREPPSFALLCPLPLCHVSLLSPYLAPAPSSCLRLVIQEAAPRARVH